MNFFKRTAVLVSAGVAVALLGGCVNAEGHFRPPDPLGWAIFDLFDPPNRNRRPAINRDAEFLNSNPDQRDQHGAPNPVWVEGYQNTSNGRQIWVPGHWEQPVRQVN